MDIRYILNNIDSLSEGFFDNQEVADKNKQAQADLAKWRSERYATQEADIIKIKNLINQYIKLKGNNYSINESISKELIESFGYDVLQEYSQADFRNDASDFGRGVASGATLGYAPEIAAKIRAATGDISYEDALKQEIAKNDAAKKRSPWLYNAGTIAPSMAVGGPLGYGIAAADLMYGKDELANPFANDSDTKPDTTEPTTDAKPTSSDSEPSTPSDSQTTSDQTSIQVDPKDIVSNVQTKLVNAGFNVGPTGIDGKFGPYTVAALKQYTAANKLPSDLDAYIKLTGDSSSEAVTEAEKIAKLRKTLSDLDEGKFDTALNIGKNLFRGIGNKAAKGGTKTSAEMAADMAKYGFADMYKPASKADTIAHGLGAGVRNTAIFGGKAAAKAAVVGGKATLYGAKIATKIGGKLSKFAANHKVASLLTGLAVYGYTFTPDGNIVATTDSEEPTQTGHNGVSGKISDTPSTTPSAASTASTASTATPEKPVSKPSPAPAQSNSAELSQLASDINLLIKYASTDTSPELTTELDNIKRQWAQISK